MGFLPVDGLFSPTHMSPEKINKTYLRLRAQTLRGFFQQTEMRPLFFRGRSILQQHRLEPAAFHGRFYCFAEKVKVALEREWLLVRRVLPEGER